MEADTNATSIDIPRASEETDMNQTSIDIPKASKRNYPRLDLIRGSGEEYMNICAPLQRASMCGDWEAAKVILESRPELVRFAITRKFQTPLHIAAASADDTKRSEYFLKNLVRMMDNHDLELQTLGYSDGAGHTALHYAAETGTMKMAEILVNTNFNLLNICSGSSLLPIHSAVLSGRSDIAKYLYDASHKLTGDYWTQERKAVTVLDCMDADLFDVALTIVRDHTDLISDTAVTVNILQSLAVKPYALNRVEPNSVQRILNSIIRNILGMKMGTSEEHTNYNAALQLLTIFVSQAILTLDRDEVPVKMGRMLIDAGKMGNTRFVVELLRCAPELVDCTDDHGRTILHVAVMHRHQDIYNLLSELSLVKGYCINRDNYDNNMLHLVGMTSRKIRPETFGASLLMQRELLWFMQVEKVLELPFTRERKNKDGETAYEIFSKENEDLVSQGLKWMKDCMVVATLIVTVAFAVAFTIPGAYNQNNGFPIFIHERVFIVFVIADAISLVSSTTSLVVFLSILTSRHNQRDFLYSLPKKVMVGLLTLFTSLLAMMVTFIASFFVLYRNNLKWVAIFNAVFGVIPVAVFTALQFPMVVDMFRSMYDSSYLFHPKTHELFTSSQNQGWFHHKGVMSYFKRC